MINLLRRFLRFFFFFFFCFGFPRWRVSYGIYCVRSMADYMRDFNFHFIHILMVCESFILLLFYICLFVYGDCCGAIVFYSISYRAVIVLYIYLTFELYWVYIKFCRVDNHKLWGHGVYNMLRRGHNTSNEIITHSHEQVHWQRRIMIRVEGCWQGTLNVWL